MLEQLLDLRVRSGLQQQRELGRSRGEVEGVVVYLNYTYYIIVLKDAYGC